MRNVLRFLSRRLGFAFIVAVMIATLPVASMAYDCNFYVDDCDADVSTSIWTGFPTVLCNPPYHVVRVQVTFKCEGDPCTVSALRCGSSTTPIVFNTCGHTHTLTPNTDWESTLTSCRLDYTHD